MITCILKAFEIGVIAGMRTMIAPALVSYKVAHTRPTLLTNSKLNFLTSLTTTKALAALAVGELIADKMPSAPDRTGQPQVWGRIGSGALSAAALTEADGESAPVGAVIGALGAVSGSFACFYLRQWLTHEKGLPDPLVAVAEDALAIGAGWWVVNQK